MTDIQESKDNPMMALKQRLLTHAQKEQRQNPKTLPGGERRIEFSGKKRISHTWKN